MTVDEREVQWYDTRSEEWNKMDGSMRGLYAYNTIRVPFIAYFAGELFNSEVTRTASRTAPTIFQLFMDQRRVLPHLQRNCKNDESQLSLLRPNGVFQSWREERGRSLRNNPLRGRRVLDVGCGGGILSLELARRGAAVTGTDPSVESIRVAKASAELLKPKFGGELPVTFLADDVAAFGGQNFDIVVASEVIEHVKPGTAQSFMDSLAEAARPGGLVALTTLTRTPFSYLAAIVVAEMLTGIIPAGTHDWRRFITPQRMGAMAERTGSLRYLGFAPLSYIPLLAKFFWSPYPFVDVTYMMAFQKIGAPGPS